MKDGSLQEAGPRQVTAGARMREEAPHLTTRAMEVLLSAASSAEQWSQLRDILHYDLPERLQDTDALRILRFHTELEGLAYAASTFDGLDSPSREYFIRTFTRGLANLLIQFPELAAQIEQVAPAVRLAPDKSMARIYPASFGHDANQYIDSAPRVSIDGRTGDSNSIRFAPTVLSPEPAPLSNMRVKYHGDGTDSLTPKRLGLEPVRGWHPARRVAPPVRLLPSTIYGRSQAIDSLSDLLSDPDGKCHVLTGDPGTGKSTVALALAQRAMESERRVWWIHGPAEAIEECMFAVADQLGVDQSDLAAARAGKRSLEELVWQRLESSPDRWLLIFDGIDSVGLMNDLVGGGKSLGWIRPSTRGLVIVSTCLSGRDAFRRYMTPHFIQHLPETDLVRLLEDSGIASNTAKKASFDIAVRYLRSTPFTVRLYAKYLATVADTEDSFDGSVSAHVDELSKLLDTKEGGQRADPVAEILQAAFKLLSTTGALDALLLLGVIAHYAPDVPIPLDFLDPTALADTGIISSTWTNGETAVQCALGPLRSLGLIEIKDDSCDEKNSGRVIHSHPLVTRQWMALLRNQSASQLERASDGAARLLAAAADRQSQSDEDSIEWIYLAAHLKSLLNNLSGQPASKSVVKNSAQAASNTITHLSRIGSYQAAINISRPAVSLSLALGEDDATRLDLETAFAKALILRGDIGRALGILERVRDAWQRAAGPENPACVDTLNIIALLLQRQGHLGQAEHAFRQALAARQRQDPDQSGRTRTLSDLARLLLQRGKLGEAERLSRRVWWDLKREGSPTSEFLDASTDLSASLLCLGKFDEAEKILRDVLSAKEILQGPEHTGTIDTKVSLALALQARGQSDEAECLLHEAVRIRQMMLGSDHPDTIDAQAALAAVLRDLGHLDSADGMLLSVLNERRQRLGTEHPDYLSALLGSGVILNDTGQLDQAEEIFRDLIRKYGPSADPECPTLLSAYHNLGAVLQNKGMLEEAEQHYRSVLASREWSLGSNHPDTLSTLANLGSLLRVRGLLGEAAQVLRQASSAYTGLLGKRHPTTLIVTASLGSVCLDSGETQHAIEIYRDVLTSQQEILGEKHPSTLLTHVNLAVAQAEQGDLAEAESRLRSTITVYEALFDVSHPRLLAARYQLARIFERKDDPRSALDEYRKVSELLKKTSNKNRASIIAAQLGVSRVLLSLDEPGESHAEYLQAIQQAIRANAQPAM